MFHGKEHLSSTRPGENTISGAHLNVVVGAALPSVPDATTKMFQYLVLRGLWCHKKVSQAKWLKEQKSIICRFWSLEVGDQGLSRVGSFWGLWGRVKFMLSSSLWVFADNQCRTLIYGHITLIFTFTCMCCSPCMHICVQNSLYTRAPVFALEPTLITSF